MSEAATEYAVENFSHSYTAVSKFQSSGVIMHSNSFEL
jgi:hypothetical protein